MGKSKRKPDKPCFAPIYIISGGTGASGLQLVNTVLAQFPGSEVPVIAKAQVNSITQLQDVLDQSEQTGGIIVHTLVIPC